MENSKHLNNLLNELIPMINISQLIRSSLFWKSLYRIRNKDILDKFKQTLLNFYKCENCGFALRRLPKGGFYCINCQNRSPGAEIHSKDNLKLECLKCFRLFNYQRFLQGCYHICGYCMSKEITKGKETCKICQSDFRNMQNYGCLKCQNSFEYQKIFELRCEHTFCSECIKQVKTEKKCILCEGQNLLTSELYEINTRDQELCTICETNQPLEKFPRITCCDLDVCSDCLQTSNNTCPGCEFSPISYV